MGVQRSALPDGRERLAGSRPRRRAGSRRPPRRRRRGRRAGPAPRRETEAIIAAATRWAYAAGDRRQWRAARRHRARPGVRGVADRDREGVGGVVGRAARGRPSRTPTICWTWSLSAAPLPADGELDRLGRVVEAVGAALGGGEHRRRRGPARPPSRSGRSCRSRGSRARPPRAGASRAARSGTRGCGRSRCSGAVGGASIMPPSIAAMLAPAIRTTPKPVLATPGSMPMTILIRPGFWPGVGCLPSRLVSLSRASG